ncbi:MAG TPA: oxygenase MpaB family protein [Amnibacterium sp.]|uniref:oxygenase MpaB family protein n=1 Tax=Amnibacterium sp. TaxID=1872496 RepID=UPI002F942152
MSRVRRIPDAPGLQLEAALLAGGLRALLLQLAHPSVGHGVAEHSDFASDPLARLRGTLTYVYVIAAGDDRTAQSVTNRIDRLHARVVSGPGADVPYDAADTDLQFWVTATIADTALRIADAVWGPLPAPLADELLARLGRIGTALGMPPERWPATRSDFEAAFADAAGSLHLDPATRAVIAELFAARGAPRWVRALMPFLIAATLPTVPTLQVELARLVPVRRPDLTPLARRLAPVYRALPTAVRRLPATRLLARERRRGAARRPTRRVGAET